MLERLTNKTKKGIIFLLSALQIGTLSGCMSRNVSKEEYEETLKKIEELKKDNNSLEEDNNELENYNESLEKSIDKITKEKEDLEKAKEQLEKEIGGLRASSSLLAIPNPIDSKPFNIDLAIKIGITEDTFNNDSVKDCINEFNTFINSFENGLYYIKYNDFIGDYNDYIKSTASIFYFANGECIGKISTLKENDSVKWLYLSYYKDNVSYSNDFKIIDNQIERVSNSSSWVYNDNYYYVNYSDNSNISIYFNSTINDDNKLFIYLNHKNNNYSLNINNVRPVLTNDDDNYVDLLINEEDYQVLKALILAYLENGQHEDMNDCRNAILNILRKYGKENEYQKYIDILTNDNDSRILR